VNSSQGKGYTTNVLISESSFIDSSLETNKGLKVCESKDNLKIFNTLNSESKNIFHSQVKTPEIHQGRTGGFLGHAYLDDIFGGPIKPVKRIKEVYYENALGEWSNSVEEGIVLEGDRESDYSYPTSELSTDYEPSLCVKVGGKKSWQLSQLPGHYPKNVHCFSSFRSRF
jgi:hypothetical protein